MLEPSPGKQQLGAVTSQRFVHILNLPVTVEAEVHRNAGLSDKLSRNTAALKSTHTS